MATADVSSLSKTLQLECKALLSLKKENAELREIALQVRPQRESPRIQSLLSSALRQALRGKEASEKVKAGAPGRRMSPEEMAELTRLTQRGCCFFSPVIPF